MLKSLILLAMLVSLPVRADADTDPIRTLEDARLILSDNPAAGFNAPAGAIDVEAVRVKNEHGSISIEFDEDRETMAAIARVHSKSELRAQNVELMLAHDEKLSILTAEVNWLGIQDGDSVELELRLPAVEAAEVATEDGSISIAGGEGTLNCRTKNGSIIVKGFKGTANALTRNGSVTLDGSFSEINATTVNGSITVQRKSEDEGPVTAQVKNGFVHISGGSGEVDANTINGSISIEAFSGTVRATTKNGAVSCAGTLSDIEVKAERGSIAIALTDEAVGPINAETQSGSISIVVGSAFVGSARLTAGRGFIQSIGTPSTVARDGYPDAKVVSFTDDAVMSTVHTEIGSISITGTDRVHE